MALRIAIGVTAVLYSTMAWAQQYDPRGNFQQNNYGVPPQQVVPAQQQAAPPVQHVPVYPYPYPYGQMPTGQTVQPFPGYCAYPGYPGCALQGGYANGGNPAAQSIVSSQQGTAGNTQLGVPQQQSPTVQVPVDPAVYQRGQSPFPGDGGRLSKLNSGGTEGGIRYRLLRQEARRIGISSGYAEEAQRLNSSTTAMAQRLDAKYDFNSLMIEGVVVPPVISEVSKSIERRGDRILYLTYGAFEVVREAKLATEFPTWREYLFLSAKYSRGKTFNLTDRREQSVWRSAYRDGYVAGKREAREAYRIALNRLDRDYRGMQTYHRLADAGAITIPRTKYSNRSVRITKGGKRVVVDEKQIRLRVNTKFKTSRRSAYEVSIVPAQSINDGQLSASSSKALSGAGRANIPTPFFRPEQPGDKLPAAETVQTQRKSLIGWVKRVGSNNQARHYMSGADYR